MSSLITDGDEALPDFQWSLAASPLANSIRESILPFECKFPYSGPKEIKAPELTVSFVKDEKLKDFTMDLKTTGNQPALDMMPPPFFAQTAIPFNYAYVSPFDFYSHLH